MPYIKKQMLMAMRCFMREDKKNCVFE